MKLCIICTGVNIPLRLMSLSGIKVVTPGIMPYADVKVSIGTSALGSARYQLALAPQRRVEPPEAQCRLVLGPPPQLGTIPLLAIIEAYNLGTDSLTQEPWVDLATHALRPATGRRAGRWLYGCPLTTGRLSLWGRGSMTLAWRICGKSPRRPNAS